MKLFGITKNQEDPNLHGRRKFIDIDPKVTHMLELSDKVGIKNTLFSTSP